MKYFFYGITILLLITWIAGVVNATTGNIMAIAAMVLSKFSEGTAVRSVV
jgi:hypothetical protein